MTRSVCRLFFFYGDLCVFVLCSGSQLIYAQNTHSFLPGIHTWSVGAEFGIAAPGNDLTLRTEDYDFGPTATVYIGFHVTQPIRLMLAFTGGIVVTEKEGRESRATFISEGITGQYKFDFASRFVPFVFLRIGGLYFKVTLKERDGSSSELTRSTFTFGGGVGIEYFISRSFSASVRIEGMFTKTDLLDKITEGGSYDGYNSALLGFSYYFNLRR